MHVLLMCIQLAAASPAEKAAAKDQATQANQDYTLGRFEQALAKYSRAYEMFPAPEFLFNIGQCQKNIGNYERALFFFQGFLRAKPNTPNRKLVEELIAQSEIELDRQKKAEAARQREIMAASIPSRAFTADAIEAPAPLYKKPWFWATISGGVVIATGVTLAILFIPPAPRAADYTLDFSKK